MTASACMRFWSPKRAPVAGDLRCLVALGGIRFRPGLGIWAVLR